MPDSKIIEADLGNTEHAKAVSALIQDFASDPMGGGTPLSGESARALIPGLSAHPTTLVFLALREDQFVGIATCFIGFSTFAGKPLINIHDLYVRDNAQGQGLGRELIEAVSAKARAIGGCKVTLEVQGNNHRARAVYHSAGFEQAVHEQSAGPTLFLSKPV